MKVSNRISDIEGLFDDVVKNGYCIGCGVCASFADSPIWMQLDEYGRFCCSPDLSRNNVVVQNTLQNVCPFSGQSLNENQLADELFGTTCQHDELIGYYLASYAGFVTEGDFRERGSSGGMGTWIVAELFALEMIDGAILVKARQPTSDDPRLFHYQLITTKEEIQNGSKSRYYPVEMSQVIGQVRNRPGRYAFVGIPCFVKGIRLLMHTDALFQQRIRFCIGLLCGHLKSTAFAEMLSWQCGIEPGKLLSIDFRKKLPGRPANEYGVEVTGLVNGQTVTRVRPVTDLYGTNWGLGFFKYPACDYCDDVVAETADIVIGDAWLSQYLKESQGTNVLVVRNPVIHRIIEQAMSSGRLHLDRIEISEVIKSQAATFRHRRDGLAYRIHLKEKRKIWYPTKRVQPAGNQSRKFKKIQNMRISLARKSHVAFKEAVSARDFSVFIKRMAPFVERYAKLYQPSLLRQLAEKVKRRIRRLLK